MDRPRLDTSPPRRRFTAWLLVVPALAAVLWGCGRDARLTGHRLREVAVGPITKYGRVLNQSATPQEVVYVLLQAIVEDYAAGGDRDRREAALDTQFAVCAPAEIIRQATGNNRVSRQQELERLFSAVHHWAPTLGYYRDDFKADFETLSERMLLVTHPQNAADVYLNVAYPDPGAVDAANAGVVARFRLVKESGYWRIWWVGWERSTRDWKKVAPNGVAVRSSGPKPTPAPPTQPADD